MVAPAGMIPNKPTISPTSASEPLTVNDKGTPTVAGIVDGHAGVGAIKSGAVFPAQGSAATTIV